MLTRTSSRLLRTIVSQPTDSVWDLSDVVDCDWNTARLGVSRLHAIGAITVERGKYNSIRARATDKGRALARLLD